MINANMPPRDSGFWIWKRSTQNVTDQTLLLRRELVCKSSGAPADLWISSTGPYLLFINGRFISFGPRWSGGGTADPGIDHFDVTFFLETGLNVIAIIADRDAGMPVRDLPYAGVWCLLSVRHGLELATDDSWQVCEGQAFYGNRARAAADRPLTDYCCATRLPANWQLPKFQADSRWSKPDLLVPVDLSLLHPYPLPPPGIDQEPHVFETVERGTIHHLPNWTQVVFPATGCTGRSFAASAWIRAESDVRLEVRIISDDPFRLFCGRQLAFAGECTAPGQTCVLELKSGWNKLLLLQTPRDLGMGFLMLLPGNSPDLRICKEPAADAPAAWNVAGPLRLPLEAATPSLNFDHLNTDVYLPLLGRLTDPATLLAAAGFAAETDPRPDENELGSSEYRLCKLDLMRYGFVDLTFKASEGDIIDISIGTRRAANGFVVPGEEIKQTGTLICREGVNHYLSRLPSDCYYLLISVRRAKLPIRFGSLNFCELQRSEHHERRFNCADAELNRFWQTGRQTMIRTAACLPQPTAGEENDVYLIDAYLDCVNMAANSGDFDYGTAQLERIAGSQLENGDIPVLTTRLKSVSQLHHLFFYPLWINYNYRLTGNMVDLERLLPSLDLLQEYFSSLLDEDGLLTDFGRRFHLASPLSMGNFPPGAIPTYLNALYCRFLLSSAEIYRICDREQQSKESLLRAQHTADLLRRKNWDPETGLFRRWQNDLDPRADVNLFSNFCALFGGVLGLENFETFFHTFFNYDPPFDKSPEADRPYFHFFFIEMLFALGQRAWAFRYFRDYWSRRLSDVPGAWKRSPDSPDPAPTRFSGGCSISPNAFLIREVLGVRIAEAGHSSIYFHPAYRLTDWAEGEIPIPHGRLTVRWERKGDGSLDVTLDSSVQIKVVPELSTEMLSMTTFRLGEEVILLDPPDNWVDNDGYLD